MVSYSVVYYLVFEVRYCIYIENKKKTLNINISIIDSKEKGIDKLMCTYRWDACPFVLAQNLYCTNNSEQQQKRTLKHTCTYAHTYIHQQIFIIILLLAS